MRLIFSFFLFLFAIIATTKKRLFLSNKYLFSFYSTFNYSPKFTQENEYEIHQTLKERSNNSMKRTCLVQSSVNGGFCNQLWRFIGFIFLAAENNCSYILIENILWKDTWGTNQMIPHEFFFDIDKWNSFDYVLPSFTSYIPKVDTDIFQLSSRKITIISDKNETHTYNYRPGVKYKKEYWKNATKPAPIAHVNPNQSINRFKQTMKAISVGQHPQPNENIYRFILSGALQPHPEIMETIREVVMALKNSGGFMIVHMRVEPDMLAQQRICYNKRVTSIKNITQMIYEKYPKPTVKHILLPVALDIMEKMEQSILNKPNETLSNIELLNRQNLVDLKNLLKYGMYGGKVKVLLAGSKLIEELASPYYKKYKVFTGSVLNYFISIESKIFIGTEVSSWSSSISNARLFRGKLQNYFFDPHGLHHITPNNDTKPHRFIC